MTGVAPLLRSAPRAAAGPRRVSILGATGSIGTSTIDLIAREPGRYTVEAVTAHRDAAALARLARDLGARIAVVADPDAYDALKQALAGSGIAVAAGPEGLIEAASRPVDWLMAAISGAAGLMPTLAALESGAAVALANKECLVCAGDLFMRRAAECDAQVLPVDSEHNALFQALSAGRREEVARLVLTASGGPFRTWTAEQLQTASPEQALRHPNWSMGAKVTIDSATLMNKGLELIEAHHLFDLPESQIDVLVHPQSIVHGLVEYHDGSMIAQLGAPDMRIPIAHCLAFPERIVTPAPRLDLAKVAELRFEAPDMQRFPALALARAALADGGAAPTVLNAANEVAVAEFLGGRIGFCAIPALVEAALERAQQEGVRGAPQSGEEALTIDRAGRAWARELLPEIAAKSG